MKPQRIVIIGGGISGLALAHRLSELRRAQAIPLDVTLLEATDRFGGLLDTQAREGFLMEGGADSFMTENPSAVELCRRLGVADQLIETRADCRRSFVVRRGRLAQVPTGLNLIAPLGFGTLCRMPLLSWAGKLRMAWEPFIPARRNDTDESVGRFIRRRLGREALERIGEPMVGGIYAADPERLSVQATVLARFGEMERRHGGVLKGLRARADGAGVARQASGPRYSLFLSLRGGLGSLVEALMSRMPEVHLRRLAAVARIDRTSRWMVGLADGESLEADGLAVALPAWRASTLLKSCAPKVAEELAGIPYESVATVNVAFDKTAVPPQVLAGFGFVAPSVEGRRLIGCTFSSVKFPGRAPEGTVLLRAFVGGALHRELLDLSDESLKHMVLEELRDLLGIQTPPRLVFIRRYDRAMPQYQVGHVARLRTLEAEAAGHPGLYLTGNGYRGIGVPDCIRQAEAVAERMVAQVTRTIPSGEAALPAASSHPSVP